ncbi:glycosyltransferase family 4 protein [Nocardiopsis coralliicola]
MKVAFLIANAYGMGGTIRSTVNLAAGLAARQHDVEIVSLAQGAARPFFPVDPAVGMRSLTCAASWRDRPEPDRATAALEREPAEAVPASEAERSTAVFNAATERAVREYLRRTGADVVVGTRPGVNSLLAAFGRPGTVRIGQEHLNLVQQRPDVLDHVRTVHRSLTAMTVLTDADRRAYEDYLGLGRDSPWLATMDNPLADGVYARSRLQNPVVAAAGRLIPVKQFPVLIRAFAPVARQHPEWRLRIYGTGPRRADAERAIAASGLHGRVLLMGRTAHTAAEFAKASAVAISSRREGLPMTICEAFAAGVPVASFDCPHGPAAMIDHRRTGLLVDDQDTDGLSAALLQLVQDRNERLRMGSAALEAADRWRPGTVAQRWEELVERVSGGAVSAVTARAAAPAAR